ncbi:cytochrome P450 4C1-like [Belonocnema kinseyi]|uniref:cytochrome P450 4C1-like n=1 Tax=Belonocnema kinseyi TaxID=2817044 RepID=UPI00143D2043|nr:cytochrome P450 4C1-like [Belonocnema kinseyi]
MLTILAYIVVSLLSLLFVIYHFLGNKELCQKISHIPGPIAFPLIGNAYLFMGNTSYILQQISKLCNTYASPCRFIIGSKVAVLIHDPEHTKAVFLSPKAAEKIEFFDFIKPWLGNGLVSAPREVWRVHRKLIQPAFVPEIMQSFVTIFQKTSISLIDELTGKVNSLEFEVYPYLSFNAFRNICESSLGMSVKTKTKEIEQFLEASERVMEVVTQRSFSPWIHSDIIFNVTNTSKVFYNTVKYLNSFTTNVIKKRRIDLKTESFRNPEEEKQKKPFLDLILEMADSENKFTEQEIREQVNTIIEGGYFTVSRVNSFTMLMLASHPEIQDKAYDEIYQIYGSKTPEENPVKFEDLKKLEYLERVIKETMRLFPMGPILGRKLQEDFSIGGYTLPKDCGIVIAILSIHRNKKYWPEPLKFDPNRFSPEEVAKQTPYTYMPFSFGPRDCIGRTYAMMSMKILIATLLRKYVLIKDNITPTEDIKIKVESVLLCPVEPISIRIERRVK